MDKLYIVSICTSENEKVTIKAEAFSTKDKAQTYLNSKLNQYKKRSIISEEGYDVQIEKNDYFLVGELFDNYWCCGQITEKHIKE